VVTLEEMEQKNEFLTKEYLEKMRRDFKFDTFKKLYGG
jgi:uncharacterized protein YnzC (UPF0291/DUF896 family)